MAGVLRKWDEAWLAPTRDLGILGCQPCGIPARLPVRAEFWALRSQFCFFVFCFFCFPFFGMVPVRRKPAGTGKQVPDPAGVMSAVLRQISSGTSAEHACRSIACCLGGRPKSGLRSANFGPKSTESEPNFLKCGRSRPKVGVGRPPPPVHRGRRRAAAAVDEVVQGAAHLCFCLAFRHSPLPSGLGRLRRAGGGPPATSPACSRSVPGRWQGGLGGVLDDALPRYRLLVGSRRYSGRVHGAAQMVTGDRHRGWLGCAICAVGLRGRRAEG